MEKIEKMKARLAEIVAKLDGYKGVEKYSDEEVTQINALSDEFATLQSQIEAAEKVEAISNKAETTTVRKTQSEPKIEITPSRLEKNGGFKSLGDFLLSVKDASSGRLDRRFQNTAFEKVGEDGGFLVPDDLLAGITKKLQADESLLAKTTQFVVSGNNLTMNIDEKAAWNGGVTAYWLAEGAPYTESKHSFAQASWKLNKLGALIKCSDEILEDAVALESYVKELAPQALMSKLNEAIISGDGVGKPQGILNSGFTVQVAKEGAQAADTVVAKNIAKMYSHMLPASRGAAVWLINPMVEEQLRIMKDDLGNFIYLAPGSQMNQSPYATLMGRPVMPMLGSLPQLGDVGDILFVDLKYYYSILKAGGMKQAMSSHLYFDRDIQAYKFTMRVDGACPFKAPVSPQYGTYSLSGFVSLEAR